MGTHGGERNRSRVVKRRRAARARTKYHRAGRYFCAVQRHCQLPRSDGGNGKIFQARGGEIIYNAEVSALSEHKNGVVICTRQGGEYEASTLISCSGLMADRLVKMLGLEPGFIICPFRGEYFRLAPEHNQIVNHLIYPIPDPAMPFWACISPA